MEVRIPFKAGTDNAAAKKDSKGVFHYTYRAGQQEEIRKIRSKYLFGEDKMEQLRRLDRSAVRKGMILSLTAGIAGCLVFGTGMCCTLLWQGRFFLKGILIGICGISGIAGAWPLYFWITKKERKKLTPRILKLTEELMK